MKKTLTMILALALVIVCSTSAIAQKHRHSDRTNGDTIPSSSVVITGNIDSIMDDFEQTMEEFGESMDEFGETMEEIGETGDAKLFDQIFGTTDKVIDAASSSHLFDYALLIPIIAVIGLFFGPVLIIGFILLYRYKRRKQRDQVVMAAINKGVDIPEDYHYDYKQSAATSAQPEDKESLNKGIKRIAIGIGLWILGASINLGILMGIGLFIVVLGGGEVLIHYLNNRGTGVRNEGTYRQQSHTTDTPQKHEGTYEKSE